MTKPFTGEKSGQIPHYEGRIQNSQKLQTLANAAFLCCSIFAIAAAAGEILLLLGYRPTEEELHEKAGHLFGALAITLPVAAVGAMSLAASFDLEARVHTYKEMLEFLVRQEREIERARSEREFNALALETEHVCSAFAGPMRLPYVRDRRSLVLWAYH